MDFETVDRWSHLYYMHGAFRCKWIRGYKRTFVNDISGYIEYYKLLVNIRYYGNVIINCMSWNSEIYGFELDSGCTYLLNRVHPVPASL